jgi:hypothetical protein
LKNEIVDLRAEFGCRMKDNRKPKEYEEENTEFNIKSAEDRLQMRWYEEAKEMYAVSFPEMIEEYFLYFVENEKPVFHEKFDGYRCGTKVFWGGINEEYDIVLHNDKCIGIIEVTYTAQIADVDKLMNKVHTFRTNFSKYQNHQAYLGIAAKTFDIEVECKCIQNGIAIIKQVEDKIIILDENLKVF